MIYSRKYSRNFIPLKQDSAKYNLDFRPSLGRCVVEIKEGKGRINIYTQGIKPSTDYYLELVGFDKGNIKNVSLGKFNVDEYGKGEFSIKFDPDNILGDNNKIEDFNVVSIMAKDNKDLSSVLVGYVGNPIDWKDKYKANFIIDIPNNNNSNCDCIKNPIENDDTNIKEEIDKRTDFEEGLIEKEEGLIEKEEGLIEKGKGLVEREKNNVKIPLDLYEKELDDKLEGLLEKEKGLADKEKGLLEKENALKQGFLPTDDKMLREKELELIRKEMELINIEQELIDREKALIRTNPTSEREKGLIEKEKGILEREQGLLEREKGLIEKEKGLLEVEKGIREKNKYTKETETKENIAKEENTNHQDFKNMLDSLKQNMLNIENMEMKSNNLKKDIEYIRTKNAIMTPFKNCDEDTSWHRISPYDLINISVNSWKYSNNLFVVTAYKKYKHLMLGINIKDETFTLAVPCIYKKDFKLKDFNTFLPVDDNVSTKNLDNGEYGYRVVEL